MSDKTKMLADQALTRARMIEWWKREKAKPKFDPVQQGLRQAIIVRKNRPRGLAISVYWP